MRILRVFAASLLCSAPAHAIPSVTILADNNVSVPVARIARDYARTRGVAVSTSFVEKETQSAQILEGSAADLLITADTKWIEELQRQGLIDIYSKAEFARGRIALVGPKDSPLALSLTDNFICAPLVHAMNYEPALFVGNPEYLPEGKYAKQALRSLRALDTLEPYMLYLKSNDEMVEQVTHHGGYGIFYYGQAQLMDHAKIIDVFPERSHSPIIYYAVVIAGDNMDEARKLAKYLGGASVRNIVRASGMLSAAP